MLKTFFWVFVKHSAWYALCIAVMVFSQTGSRWGMLAFLPAVPLVIVAGKQLGEI